MSRQADEATASGTAKGHLLPAGREGLREKRKAAAIAQPDAAQKLLLQFQKIDLPVGAITAGYAAIGDEIDPLPIMAWLAAEGHATALPVMVAADAPLLFRRYHVGDALSCDNPFKVPQPTENNAAVMPNIVLVPLLAFDRRGNRVGYGKGFYDRTLAALRAQNPTLIAIGLAYGAQEAEITPQPHDQPLNMVVTPAEVIYCPPS